MKRIIVLALAAAFAAFALSGLGQASTPKLVGTSGPSFTIGVTKGGKKVTKLKAGKYTVVVKDIAKTHDYHLKGPGVDKKTPVKGKGTFTWHLTLKKGTYRYVCDPHKALMTGSFKVT